MPDTFTCARCKKVLPSVWSDEEAIAEKDKLFPDVPTENCVVVCDECFTALRAIHN